MKYLNPKLKKLIEDKGFVLIARDNQFFKNLIDKLPGEKKKYLSMWKGYVDVSNAGSYNPSLAKALGEDYEYMHTSGHSDVNGMSTVFSLLRPKTIIPIHTNDPEEFKRQFGDNWSVEVLNDGESIEC